MDKKFNSTADIIGKSITLDDKSYRVVGVIPSSFIFLLSTDVYVALGASACLRCKTVAAHWAYMDWTTQARSHISNRPRLTSLE
jgi:hypothetical protein